MEKVILEKKGKMDLENNSKLETSLLDLIDLASQAVRQKEEARRKSLKLEEKINDLQKDLDKLKKERMDEREMYITKERNLHSEKTSLFLEVEKSRCTNEELMAKVEYFRNQAEGLQATAAMMQQHQQGGGSASFCSMPNQSNRLPHLVAKEVVEQIREIHENLKALESRASTLTSQATMADSRATEMERTVDKSKVSLKLCQNQLENLQRAHKETLAKSRADATTISALHLDVEGLQEQVNRLKEEVANLSQHRRNLENELERTKLTVATSLVPLLEKMPGGSSIVDKTPPSHASTNVGTLNNELTISKLGRKDDTANMLESEEMNLTLCLVPFVPPRKCSTSSSEHQEVVIEAIANQLQVPSQ